MPPAPHKFRAGFLFCGLGAGARGFLQAKGRLGTDTAEFVNVGGIDNDPLACADFEYLTGAPAFQADLATMQPATLRRAWGARVPDAVFTSPPCKGFSGLLSNAASQKPHYQDLNRLVLQGFNLVCSTWKTPPAMIVLENVPRIQSRGAGLLAQVRQLLHGYGFVFNEETHDCGEIGGLAQHRRRFLLVARLPVKVPGYVYRPELRRVLPCGDVLGRLPVPQTETAGRLHLLPKLSGLNWVRLALIPAGGDWRDLPKTVALPTENPGRHEAKYRVERFADPAHAVTGATRPGSGAPNVADPRLESPLAEGQARRSLFARYKVQGFDEPSGPVTGDGANGTYGVADPRTEDVAQAVALKSESRPNLFGVLDWERPALAVTASAQVSGSNGVAAVADPRVEERRRGSLGVTAWEAPSATVTGESYPSNGSASVADPRINDEPWRGSFGVIPWSEPAPCVRGASPVRTSRSAVGDPRLDCSPRPGAYGVLDWRQPSGTVTGNARLDNARAALADPRFMEAKGYPLIISEDGTWHRPLTTLELAALQGIPARVNGEPLRLAGQNIAKWRERIGNAVPVGAAEAIAGTLLKALLAAKLGIWTLSSTAVWVRKDGRAAYEWAQDETREGATL